MFNQTSLFPKIEGGRKNRPAHICQSWFIAGKTAYPMEQSPCATKSAVHSLGESINADLFGTNVKVTTIAPGAVKTNFSNYKIQWRLHNPSR